MHKKPEHLRALITGASRGIGAAIALELSRIPGCHVILNYRSNDKAAAKVRDQILSEGGQVSLAKFDVANREDATHAVEKLLLEGPISILINNAGVAADGLFPTLQPEAWDRVLQTSLNGFYHVTQPLVMPMIRQRWGRIVTISSISGEIGNRGQVNYSAAKAGLIGATKALAKEVARRGVTVNAVTPGLIETEMIENIPLEHVLPLIPMKRLGKPEEIAKVVAFLCSEDASYMTGQILGVNGGMA